MKISAYRNRLAVDTAEKSGINEQRTGGNPFHWNGSAVQFEIAFFDKGALVDDLSNLDQVQVELKRGDLRTGLAVMGKVIASGELNGGLTLEDWKDGEEAACHALISFSGAEANIDLQGDLTGEFWLVISALRADGEPITLGCAQYSIEEDGRGVVTPPGITTPTYLTLAQSDARYLMAIDLTTIENDITALQGDVSDLQTDVTAVTTTASGALQRSGGTMTGAIVLSGAPTTGLHPATKTYVDTADALKLALAGGTMTGLLTLSGAPTSSLHAATKAYADLRLALAGGTMTGDLILADSIAGSSLKAASQGYVDTAVAALVNSAPSALDTLQELSAALGDDSNFASTMTTALAGKLGLGGGTMTGHVSLYTGTNPTGAQALSKGYADSLYLALAGGTMTGALTLSGAPSGGNHATTKTYVDTADALKLALAGGTMTGLLQWSTTSSAGLRLNNLTDAQRSALSPSAGNVIFNTTTSNAQLYNGSAWITLATGTGTNWLTGSGAPSGGLGSNGDYYLDSDTADIYLKSSGSWALAGPQKLSLSGGTMTGALILATDTLRLTTARTPASSGATGSQGMICWDASYIYVCTATNTWRRAAHSTW